VNETMIEPRDNARTGLAGRSLDKVDNLVDAWLDKVLDEPFDVPDDATAVELMTNDTKGLFESQGSKWVALGIAGLLSRARFLARLGSRATWVTRIAVLGSEFAFGRVYKAVRFGLQDLKVIASYLVARARREGTTLSPDAIRAITTSVFVDDRRKIDTGHRGHRAGAGVAKALLKESANPTSQKDRRRLAERRIAVLDRLDLADYKA
jgi:hypothetical protein